MLFSWWQVWHDKFKRDLESEESKNWYTKQYENTVLKNLDAKELHQKLLEMSENNDICLLCYETPEKFCHRHIVAKWLNDNGISCEKMREILPGIDSGSIRKFLI